MPSPIGVEEKNTDGSRATLIIRFGSGKEKAPVSYQVPAGQSILEALGALHLPLSQPPVAVVNGVTSDLAYILQPGDVANLLPQIAGG
jgi:hypothetical protein